MVLSVSICVSLLRLVHGKMRFLGFVPLVNAQGPTGRSLYFSSQQGTFPFPRELYEKALRRDQGLDSHRVKLPGHMLRGE